MSHLIEKNQVVDRNDIKTVYSYSYFATDGTGVCDISNFTAKKSNVALSNDKIIVLDDDMFTRISIDKNSSHGLNQINEPLMFINIENAIMGTGFNFSLCTDYALTADELQEIIITEFSKKVSPLISLTIPDIDDAMIRDAMIVSSYENEGEAA